MTKPSTEEQRVVAATRRAGPSFGKTALGRDLATPPVLTGGLFGASGGALRTGDFERPFVFFPFPFLEVVFCDPFESREEERDRPAADR